MTDDFITDAIWNQDIVDNTIANHRLAAIAFLFHLIGFGGR